MMTLTMMAALITPSRVALRLRANGLRHVVDELVRIVAPEPGLEHGAACRSVLTRGEVSTFGFGRGVAIPHATVPGLIRPVGVFALLDPAQDFGAADGILADLVFLLLSPEGDDPTHLRALACVARRLRDREVAARLRSAKDAEAVHVMLTSDAWRHPTGAGNGHSATPHLSNLTNGAMCTSFSVLC